MKSDKTTSKNLSFVNRKAKHDYNIMETFNCGMFFTGQEVKFIRNGQVTLSDNFIVAHKKEAILTADFTIGNIKRERHILLKKRVLEKLILESSQKGLTLIVLELYEDKKMNQFRIIIGLVKGNKKYDKRAILKEKDLKREQERYD